MSRSCRAAAAVLRLALGAVPAHVRELAPDAGLPAGFRAAGVAGGIKPSGELDLGLLVCDAGSRVARRASPPARARGRAGARSRRERCRLDALRAVVANSGCANAATGRRGARDAAKTQGAAALASGVSRRRGRARLDRRDQPRAAGRAHRCGRARRRRRARRDGDGDFPRAIQTTDAIEKRAQPGGRAADRHACA